MGVFWAALRGTWVRFPSRPMKVKQTESDLVRQLCDYLALRKHFFWRSNNTPIFDQTKGVFRAMPKYTPRGIPDICVIRNGKFIGLEAKTETGTQSMFQQEFEEALKSAGGAYHLVRSVEDLQKIGL